MKREHVIPIQNVTHAVLHKSCETSSKCKEFMGTMWYTWLYILCLSRYHSSIQHYFSLCCSVVKSCPTLSDPVDCSTPGFPVLHQLSELAQTHVHWVSDAIQPSHPLSSPSPAAFCLFQRQGLFQWVGSSHQVAKVLELQLQPQSFQWIPSTDFL